MFIKKNNCEALCKTGDVMDLTELKQEQLKLSSKVVLRDGFTQLKTIGGVDCVPCGKNLLACVVVCEFPSLTLKEKKTFLLPDPLPFMQGFLAYREMLAIVEAFNLLEEEPDVLFVDGAGIMHPRRFDLASHVGLVLNKPTIGVSETISVGSVDGGKVIDRGEIVGFEVVTREHAKPLYFSPGHLISLGSVLDIVRKTVMYPHKLPEPLHLAHKLAKKKMGEMVEKN